MKTTLLATAGSEVLLFIAVSKILSCVQFLWDCEMADLQNPLCVPLDNTDRYSNSQCTYICILRGNSARLDCSNCAHVFNMDGFHETLFMPQPSPCCKVRTQQFVLAVVMVTEMWDMSSSQHCFWGFGSSGMWCCVVAWMLTSFFEGVLCPLQGSRDAKRNLLETLDSRRIFLGYLDPVPNDTSHLWGLKPEFSVNDVPYLDVLIHWDV